MSSRPLHLYYATGARPYFRMTRLSILSLLKHGGSPNDILVFTDRPDAFSDLAVRTRPLDRATLADWSGPIDFVHRRKVQAVRHAQIENPGRALLFADSDTYWLAPPPEDLSVVRLHAREPRFSARILAGYQQIVRTAGWTPVDMFNSGLVGLPAQLPPAAMDDVLSLTDLLSLHMPQRMEWVEQYAFCVGLNKYGPIHETGAELMHYWYYGRDFAILTADMPDADFYALTPASLRTIFDTIDARRRTLAYKIVRRWKTLKRSILKRRTQWRAFRARRRLR